MNGPGYFARAFYMGAYNGSVTALLQRHEQEEEAHQPSPERRRQTPAAPHMVGRSGVKADIEVEATKAGIGNSALADVIEMD